jgi:hypothetical protein
MSVKLSGGLSNTEVDVNARKQMLVATEVDALNNAASVGASKIFSENDAGEHTGEVYLKSPETSSDYRMRVGIDTLLFEDAFNATTQNTDIWSYTFATLTAAQPGAGTVNFSTVQGTTSAHGANMRTFRYFPLVNTAPLAIEHFFGKYTSPLVNGEVFLTGLGLPGSAILPPTDGIFWKLTSAGLEGIIKYNNVETSTGVLKIQDDIPLDEIHKYLIVIGEGEVEFWQDDILLSEIEIPHGNPMPFISMALPLFMQKYNTGAVSNTNQMRVSRVAVTLMDVNTNKLWGHQLASMGRTGYVGQNGMTQGLTAGNYAGTGAIVATQAGSNTAPNAAMAGMGGVFQMTAQVSSAGASGDMVASYYLNPAGTINITGRNLVVTGVKIAAINYGAVIATTPTTLLWGLHYGGTAVTLATAESASFATATAHAPRKIPLGFMYAPIGAVIGQTYDKEVVARFDGAPIVVRPGEYLGTTVRFLVGTATASQTVVYTVTFDAYFE